MKNNLFRKFLAVFLTGTLLGAVGCKDYDDDINDLKGQIDDLKGKIELKADASALSSLQQKLEGINFDDFVKDAELDKMIKDLGYQTAEDVKALIPEGMSTEDVKNIFDAQIKALDTWGEIESNIGKAVKEYLAGSEYTTAQQNQIVNTILKQIDPTAQDIKTAIKNVLGTEFGGYMEEYMTKDDFRGSLDEAAAELLKKENGKLAAGIAEMISSEGFLEQAGLKEKFEGYDAAIKSLRSDVDALIAQIQSLVYVPEALDGQVVMAAYKVGDTELEKGVATLTYRVTPAKALDAVAAIYAKNPACLSMISEKVIATRAAEPASAPVAVTGFQADENGKFTVTIAADKETMDALADNNKSVALALSIQSPTKAPAEGDADEEEVVSGVTNDVLSDFAGVKYEATAKEVAFALYKDGEVYSDETIMMPFNSTVAESKATLLKDVELKASLDGANFLSLDEVSNILGQKISVSAYRVKVTYTNPADAEVTGTDIDKFIIKGVVDKLSWNDKLATAEFRAEAKSSDVKSKAVFAHTLTMAVTGKATTAEVTNQTTYQIANQKGTTIDFGKLSKEWTYQFVNEGGNTTEVAPAINADVFGEVAMTLSGKLPAGVTVIDILGETPVKKITDAEGKDVTATVDAAFEPFVGQIANGTKVTLPAGKYAWGNTYTVEYVYTHENIDYTLTGTIEFGAIPQNVELSIEQTIGYNDITKTISWADLYKKVAAGYFKDAAEFASAATTSSKDASASNMRYADAEDENGELIPQNNPDGTYIEVNAAKGIEAQIVSSDIKAAGNIFVQTYERETWYGQKIKTTVTTTVELPAYELNYNTQYVIDESGKKTAILAGEVVDSFVWGWKNANLLAYFNIVTPEGATPVEISYEKVSVDGKNEAGKNDVTAKYAAIDGDKLDWTNATRDYVDLKAAIKIKGTNIQVGAKELRVRIQTPITTLAQTKGIETKYVANEETEINLFENLEFIDANGKKWIEYDSKAKVWKAVVVNTDDTAYEVFKATSGNTASAGIAFEIVKAENSDKSETKLDLLEVKDNKLVYKNNSALLQLDFTVTLKATFTYQYGSKTAETITVTVKH